MKPFFAVILSLFVSFYGCKQNSESEDNCYFPSFKESKLEAVKIQGNLLTPLELVLNGEIIVVYDYSSDYFFHFFSNKDFQPLTTFLRRGIEQDDETMVSPHFRFVGKDTLMFKKNNFINCVHFENKTGALVFKVLSEIALPEELISSEDFFLIKDTLFASIAGRPSSIDFQGFCLKTGSIFSHGLLAPVVSGKYNEAQVERVNNFNLNLKFTTVKPDKSRIATIYFSTPVLRAYSSKNWELIAECQMIGVSSNQHYSNFINYYSIRSTNEFIFALFSDTPPPPLIRDGDRWRHNDVANEIHVWDWDGNPIMKIKLDRLIYSFDVAPDNQKIIALSTLDAHHLFLAKVPWD